MGQDSKKMIRFQWRFAILAACVALGVAAGIASVPELFRLTGMAGRYGQLDKALNSAQANKANKANTILLGNSMVMNGLDAKLLNTLGPKDSHAWNFSTEGQRLPEAIMIMQRLAPNVKTVIWGLSYSQLAEAEHDVPLNVTSRWDYCDFTPCEELLELAQLDKADVFADYWAKHILADILPKSCEQTLRDIKRDIKGRWVFKHFIDTRLREMLRKDMNMQRMEQDLYFPNPFTVHIEKDKLAYLLKACYSPRAVSDANISDFSTDLLKLAYDISREKDFELIIVLMPEHPYQQNLTEADYYKKLDTQLKKILPCKIFDFHNTLGEDEFVDVIHADDKGAKKLTRKLAAALKTNGGKGK